MKNQRRNKTLIPRNIWYSLLLFSITIIMTASIDWGCIWTYHEYHDGNIASQAGVCVRLEQSWTDEASTRSGEKSIYVLLLENGTRLGIYKDLADEYFSTGWRIEALDFLKNQEFTFTYIPKKIFTDGSYVLLSISNGSESILDEQHVLSYYLDWLWTALILSCIVDGIALLLVIVPPIYRLIVRRKEQAKNAVISRKNYRKNYRYSKKEPPKIRTNAKAEFAANLRERMTH